MTELVNESILHTHWIEGETISDLSGEVKAMSGKRLLKKKKKI